jgi:hypothetical protein
MVMGKWRGGEEEGEGRKVRKGRDEEERGERGEGRRGRREGKKGRKEEGRKGRQGEVNGTRGRRRGGKVEGEGWDEKGRVEIIHLRCNLAYPCSCFLNLELGICLLIPYPRYPLDQGHSNLKKSRPSLREK